MKTDEDGITIVSDISYIESLNEWLTKLPNDSNLHYMKANELVNLAGKTKDTSYYNEALTSYNRAIELSPQNLYYLLNRGKLYIILNEFDLALIDLLKAQEILESDDSSAKDQAPALSIVLEKPSTPSEAESYDPETGLTGMADN